jgi:hypothetical protein
MNVNVGISGIYELSLRSRASGAIFPLLKKKNLITNVGMNAPARYAWVKLTEVCVVGDGSAAAQVTNRKLNHYVARSTTYAVSANGLSFPNQDDGDYSVRDYSRTYLAYSNTGTSSVSISELGVTWDDSDNPDLFSHVVLNDPVSVPTGMDLLVKYTLRLTSDIETFKKWKTTTLNIGSQSIPGRIGMFVKNTDDAYYGMCYTTADGKSAYLDTSSDNAGRARSYHGLLEPSVVTFDSLFAAIDEQASNNTSSEDIHNLIPGVRDPYIENSYEVTRKFVYPATLLTSRSDLCSIAVGMGSTSWGYLFNMSNYPAHQIRFLADAPFTKPASAEWTVTMKLNWARATN